MEIHKCLQELLQDANNQENGVHNYLDVNAAKLQGSFICFNGTKFLPPLLSDEEKVEMREYRRKAVDLEQKHFEAKKQKYSNFLLEVMDRCQRKEVKTRTNAPIPERKPKNSNAPEKENIQGLENKMFSKTNQVSPDSIKILQDNKGNYNSLHEERMLKETSGQNIKDDLPDSSSIFQKPKLYNFSLSPRKNKVDASDTNESSRISQTLWNLSLEEELSASRSDRIITRNEIQRGCSGSEKEISASDSLASTVLSVAFTDSSVASQLSAIETMQQTVIMPVQRKLNMDGVNHHTNQSHYQNMKPITSTPNELQRPDTRSSQRAKKKAPFKHGAVVNMKSTETYSEQDRALEKLEMMRKKLMEEKEKQIALIRQQELARLRKNKNIKKQFDTQLEESDVHHNEQFMVHPASDMYSIPERSYEGSMTLRGDDQNEAESASDKENNLYRYDPHCRIHHDMNSVVHYREDLMGNVSQARRSIGDGPLPPSPYMRQAFLNQFEMVMTQGCDGRDKFSILTAYSKGFLTRCLIKAEKVQSIIKTIKDTSQFLADISKEGTSSYQDKTLQQRVQAQLVAAKQKLHDIFFKIPVHDRMACIAHSRNVAKEKEERQYNERKKKSGRKLSSATLKAMQRRVGEQNENSDIKKIHSPHGKRKTLDTRVLKLMQSTKSPQLKDKGRLVGKRRPGTAPSPRHSIIKKNTYTNRPATAMANRKSISRRSLESDGSSTRKPSRMSLEGKPQTAVKRTKANDEEKSKLPVRRGLSGGLTYRLTKGEEEDKDTLQARLSMEGSRRVKQDPTVKSDRPKTASGTRRITRSMAAKFSKS